MSRRPRKTAREICSSSIIEEARKRIEKGESKRQVALSLGMAESTLRYRLLQPQCATKLGRYDVTFSVEVEQGFCNHLITLDEMFFGLTAKQLRSAAYEYAEKHKIPHRFNTNTKIAGKEWFRGFMQRHPEISLRQPTSTSIARAMGFNRPQVERFYIKLSALMDKYKFPPQSIYNMDETGISTVPNRPPRVLSVKGKRAVNKISSAERGINVTAVNAVSATGHFIPPAFIFKRKRMKAELIDGAPAGSIGMVSDSSFINGDLFIDWLSHFRYHTKPSVDQPVLLILDNHVSHCSLKAIDFYRQNNIVALTLPPHCSHKIQPLDRGFHSALKKYYASECEKWLRNHPGRAITTFQLTSIFTPAFYKAATVACGVESFKSTGIWPWNPEVFTDADFMASTVTEREHPENSNAFEIDNDDFPADNPIEAPMKAVRVASDVSQTPKVILLENTVDCTSISQDPAISSVESVKTSYNQDTTVLSNDAMISSSQFPSTSQSSGIKTNKNNEGAQMSHSLEDIVPIPRSQLKRSSNRKHKQAEVISSSPYKNQLEEKQKPAPNTNAKRAKKAFKKPKSLPKKKIWRCGGCNEVYIEPIVEDWIECDTCRAWWHEKCTDYLGFGAFKCDLCK